MLPPRLCQSVNLAEKNATLRFVTVVNKLAPLKVSPKGGVIFLRKSFDLSRFQQFALCEYEFDLK